MDSDSSEDEPASAKHCEDGPLAGIARQFTTTHWSVVQAAGYAPEKDARNAMEELCRTYWYPLYAYVRRRGHSVEESQDLTQEFFARLIEKHWLAEADASRGRFRNFLLGSLKHFLANERRHSRAAKRGGGQVPIALDDTAEARYVEEAVSDLTPERIYERRWARSVFEQALRRLRDQHVAAGKTHTYEVLVRFLSADTDDGEYIRLGKELEMSPAAVATAVHRLRQHYRRLVREAVAQTVDSPAELEEEMRWLLNALN